MPSALGFLDESLREPCGNALTGEQRTGKHHASTAQPNAVAVLAQAQPFACIRLSRWQSTEGALVKESAHEAFDLGAVVSHLMAVAAIPISDPHLEFHWLVDPGFFVLGVLIQAPAVHVRWTTRWNLSSRFLMLLRGLGRQRKHSRSPCRWPGKGVLCCTLRTTSPCERKDSIAPQSYDAGTPLFRGRCILWLWRQSKRGS